MTGEDLHRKYVKDIFDRLGDQRAKDLVDDADGVPDLRERIALLHRALRYGRRSIQSKKAYQSLGLTYEELGKPSLAIRNYTKAIVLGEALDIAPVPILYRRGFLYYQRGETEAARHDLEQALAMDDFGLLYRDYQGRARRLLTEL